MSQQIIPLDTELQEILKSLRRLAQRERDRVIINFYRTGNYSLRDIAHIVGVSHTEISNILKRGEK